MERPDESLIKDADLRRELERHRHRTGGANGMFHLEVRILIEKQEERDAERAKRAAELAALPREKRRRAIVREVFENSSPSPADVRHIHSVLAVCGLPYDRQPLDTRVYERRQGKMSLLVKAGEIMTPDGAWKQQPLPYGPKARLILMHLCTEALHNNTPTIELADTFTAFVQKLGFSKSGGERGPLTAFKQQLNALAACDLRMGTWNGTSAKTKSFKPINDFDVWLSDNPAQRSLWPSTVTFSEEMFESLKRHAIPVNIQAIKAIQGSARKLDLYFWLGYRLNNIEETLHISWQALSEQFGTGFTRPRDFHRKLGEEIAHIKEIFPRLPIKLNEQGITLQPAGPDVLTLPAPRSVKSR